MRLTMGWNMLLLHQPHSPPEHPPSQVQREKHKQQSRNMSNTKHSFKHGRNGTTSCQISNITKVTTMSEERRAFNTDMALAIGRIEGKLEVLCGPEGRITKIEKSQTRQWWFSMAVAPFLAIAQAVARKLGVIV